MTTTTGPDTHTETCSDCGWTTKPGTPAKTRSWLRYHKCGSEQSRRDMRTVVVHRRTSADVAEDVEWILRWDPWQTRGRIAERLGYRDVGGLDMALKRANRRDLIDQLNRNAEVAA